MVQFSTADANAFVKEHPKCEVTFSDRSCVVRVSHVKLLYMNTQESVSVRFLIRITKNINFKGGNISLFYFFLFTKTTIKINS